MPVSAHVSNAAETLVARVGAQQHELLQRTVHEQREAAMRGGVPGTEFDVAAKLSVEGLPAATRLPEDTVCCSWRDASS